MSETYDALVAGAGPSGSTAAALLARAGWKTIVVEKASFPRRKVCGEYISGAAWPLLEELGIEALIAADAGPEVRRVGLYSASQAFDAPMPHLDAFRAGRSLGREHLDTRLLERAVSLGAQARQPAVLARVERERESFACLVDANGEEERIRARIVIGAHGAWEAGGLPTHAARRAAGPRDLLGFKAHFSGASLAPDLMPLILFPGGYGGMVSTDAGRLSLSCCVRREALAAARALEPELRAGEALFAHILRNNRGCREALRGARIEGAWLSAGPIRPSIRAFRQGGIFAVGNAAGEAHPIVAEGISMAIQSSALLCERLVHVGPRAEDPALARVAEDYERAWRRNFTARVRVASGLAALTTSAITHAAAVTLVSRLPSLLTRGAHWSGKDQRLRGCAFAGTRP